MNLKKQMTYFIIIWWCRIMEPPTKKKCNKIFSVN